MSLCRTNNIGQTPPLPPRRGHSYNRSPPPSPVPLAAGEGRMGTSLPFTVGLDKWSRGSSQYYNAKNRAAWTTASGAHGEHRRNGSTAAKRRRLLTSSRLTSRLLSSLLTKQVLYNILTEVTRRLGYPIMQLFKERMFKATVLGDFPVLKWIPRKVIIHLISLTVTPF